jgi:hypothetical protein
MKVNIKDLRAMINRMLDLAEEKRGPQIELDDTFFHVIMFDEAVEYTKEPKPTLAALKDDVTYVLENYYENGPISQTDYEKMGNVIKAIGYEINPKYK